MDIGTDRQTDGGQKVIPIAHPEHSSGELKRTMEGRIFTFTFVSNIQLPFSNQQKGHESYQAELRLDCATPGSAVRSAIECAKEPSKPCSENHFMSQTGTHHADHFFEVLQKCKNKKKQKTTTTENWKYFA